MRYGATIHHSKATAQIMLDRIESGEQLLWTQPTVAAMLRDIITLHDEAEHERREKEHHRCEAGNLRRAQAVERKGW